MKKIEKFEGKEFYSPDGLYASTPTMHDIGKLQVKVNEIIDRLNQSVSQPDSTKGCNCDYCKGYRERNKTVNVDGNDEQHDGLPEPVMRETIRPNKDDIEIVFNDDTKQVCKYCGGSNVGTHNKGTTYYYFCRDCGRATDLVEERDMTMEDLLESRIENNTEEWNKVKGEDWKATLTRYFSDTESPMKIGYGRSMKDLIEFIEQLLSERSFSKEELERIKIFYEAFEYQIATSKTDRDIKKKVDRLLSEEK